MAEADTVTPSAPAKSPLSDSTTGGFEDFLAKQTERNQVRGDELMGKVGEVTGRIRQIDKQVDRTTPPQPIPMPQKPDIGQTNPMEAFGSAASWLAVFGGFLTKRPMTTALNSAAGVMNAVKEKNYEQAKFSMKEWKASSENVAANNQFQVDAYKNSLAKFDSNRKDAIAELQSYTAAFKDITGSDLLSARMYADFQKHVVALEEMGRKAAKDAPDQYIQFKRQELFDQITQARQSGDPRQVEAAQTAMADFNRAFPAHGGAAVTASDNKTKVSTEKANKIIGTFQEWKKTPGNEDKGIDDFVPSWQKLNGTIDPDVKVELKKMEIDAKSIAKDAVSSAWRTYHEQNPSGSWEDFVKTFQELHGTISPADKKALKEQEIEARKVIAQARPQSVDQRAAGQFEKETQAREGRPPNAAEWQKFKQGLSVAAAQKAQTKQGVFDVVGDSIDEALTILDGDFGQWFGVSGLGGIAERPLESVLTTLGYMDTAPAHLFEDKLATIQTMVPRLLTSSAKTAKDERERLNTIVSGLKMGQSQVVARQNLTELKELLKKIKAKEFGDTGGYTSAEDVKAAVSRGELDKDAGVKLLREKFGFQ